MKRLAIVIPAYKQNFLDDTLRSISKQSCQEFTVYIGDDASPNDLKTICNRWESRLDIRYFRFDANLGGSDLVGHWGRCVALSKEPWIWLFSDDDIMEPGCVAAFMRRLDSDPIPSEIYHFNVRVIDRFGQAIREAPRFPDRLSAADFACRRFSILLESFAPDYIFERNAFERVGGFQSFPRAWCSDDATWIKLASQRGITTIAGPMVYWRSSGLNISSEHTADALPKFEAAVQYLEWIAEYLPSSNMNRAAEIDMQHLLMLGRWWLYRQAEYLGVFLTSFGVWGLSRRMNRIFKKGVFNELTRLVLQDLRSLRKWHLTTGSTRKRMGESA